MGLALITDLAAAGKDDELWDNLKKLQVGQKIEVGDMSFKSLTGTFISSSEEAIALHTRKGDVSVRRPEVRWVSSRERSKRMRHILIGAAIGAGAFAGLSYYCAFLRNEGGNAAACVAAMVGIGSGIGAGMGASFPGYLTIYRAPKTKNRRSP